MGETEGEYDQNTLYIGVELLSKLLKRVWTMRLLMLFIGQSMSRSLDSGPGWREGHVGSKALQCSSVPGPSVSQRLSRSAPPHAPLHCAPVHCEHVR